MDYSEREVLLRRICSGKLYTKINIKDNEFTAVFTDPNLHILTEADFIYKTRLEELKENPSLFTLEESYSLLRRDKIWNDRLDSELEDIPDNIKQLEEQLPLIQFQKSKQKVVLKGIEKLKNRQKELYLIKNQLEGNCIENLAEVTKRRFITSKIIKVPAEYEYLLNDPLNIDVVSVYYYRTGNIPEKDLREISRTDPGRLYISTAKEMSMPLFNCSASEMTEKQKIFVFWSKIYSWVYEHTERPSDDIINNDEKFDAWYAAQARKIKSETNKNSLNKVAGSGSEVFVMSDALGAKEVYEMNSSESRKNIKKRQNALSKKGVLEDAELPDVKQNLEIQINNEISKANRR